MSRAQENAYERAIAATDLFDLDLALDRLNREALDIRARLHLIEQERADKERQRNALISELQSF